MQHCNNCTCDNPKYTEVEEVEMTIDLICNLRQAGKPDPGVREVARFLERAPMTGGKRRIAALKAIDGDKADIDPQEGITELGRDGCPMFGPWS